MALAFIVIVTQLPLELTSLRAVTQFLLVMSFLSLFDVWLPHGDRVDIVGPLTFGAIVLLGPIPTIGIAGGSRLLAHVLRYRFERTESLLHALSRRTIATGVCGLLFNWLANRPWADSTAGTYAVLLAVAGAFTLLDLVLQQSYTAARQGQAIGPLLAGNFRLQGLLMAAQVSAALLCVVLYPAMDVWGLLLLAILLVVMRQSFSMLLDIRQAYRTTMEAMAVALEAHDASRQGHAERVAALARAIGIEVGIRGKDLERLGYAALLHDVDLMGEGSDGPEGEGDACPARRASEILVDVRFLADVIPVLRLCEGRELDAQGAERLALLAYVVCRASNLDELLQGQGKRVAGRQYPQELLTRLLDEPTRERVENALWKLLTPGARGA